MSETNDKPIEPTNDSTAKDAMPPGKPAKAKGRWRRRFKIVGIVLVVLAIIFRIALYFTLPTVIHKVAAHYGLDCTYDRMQLSLSGGDVGIWHLALTPKSGGDAILKTDYVRGNISVVELFKGRLEVWRAEVDGGDMVIDRGADGRIANLQKLINSLPITRSPAPASPTTGPATTRPAARPIDLASPLRIEALRLSRMRIHLLDHSVTPQLDAQLQMNIRVSDVGAVDKPTSFEVDIWSDQILDALHVVGEGRTTSNSLQASVQVALSGLHPKPLAGYIQPFSLKPASNLMSVRLNAVIQANVLPDGRFAGKIRLKDFSATADAEETLGADAVAIDLESLDASKAVVPLLQFENPRATVKLTPSLSLVVAGLEIDTQTPRPESSQSLPRIEIGQFTATGGAVSITDGRITQSPQLRALIRRVSSANIVVDQNEPDQAFALKGEFELPGLAKSATLDISARPLAARKTVDLTVHATGVRPDIAKPYLDMLGIRSELKDASFDCAASASLMLNADRSVSIEAHASKVILTDGKELLNLQDAAIAGLRIDPARNLVRVESIDVNGPNLAVRHDASGAVALFGMNVPIPLRLPSGQIAREAVAPANLPRLEIGRLTWKGVRLSAEDQAVSPPAIINVADAGMELSNLCLDLNPKADAVPAKIDMHLNAPGLAREFRVQGTVTPHSDAIALDLTIAGQGLSPTAVQSYLKPLNIQPLIRDGSLNLQFKADVKKAGDSVSGSLSVQGLRLTDGGDELARVDSLRIGQSSGNLRQIDLSSVELTGAGTSITREADGRFVVLGVRLPPIEGNAAQGGGELPVLTLRQLRVRDSSLGWTDLAVKPQVRTQALASVELDNLTLGKAAPPATLKLTAKVKDVIDSATVSGQIVTGPQAQSAVLDIEAAGIHAGALSPYIPPQVDITLKDGRVKTHLEAGLSSNPKGGYAASLDLGNLNYRDGESSLVKLDSFKLHASRLDPKDLIIALDEFSVAGLETDVRRLRDGSLAAGGLRLPPAAPAPTTRPAIAIGATPADALNPELMAAQARKLLPLITVTKLDVSVKRLGLVDQANPSLPPVSLHDFRMNNQGPIEWLGKDANSNPPTKLQLTGGLDPLADQFSLNVTTAPFVNQPTLNAELTATGIRGSGLHAFIPQLDDRVDFSPLKSGQFKAAVESQIKLDRRVANDFDLSRGFDLNLLVRDVEFRPSPDAPMAAGLKELRTENARINPAAGIVHLRNLEITNPSAVAVRQADGLHAMGVLIRLPELPSTRPADLAGQPPATQPAIALAPASRPSVAQASAPTTRPTGEIRIDRLLVSGVDVRIEDRVLDPVLIVPLNSLDLEVRDLTTTALYEPKPIRFNLIAAAGKVTVPKKPKSAGIPGAIGDIALLAGGKKIDATPQFEERELFSQVVASGNFQLYPKPEGWAKASVTGFELASVSGAAKYFGITLSNGTFDASTEVRIQPDGTGDARARAVLNDLRVAEPPNGPIARHLALPAPLDAAIAAVQDADGSITLPVKVQIKDNNIDGIPSAAVAAAGHVIATAIISAPAKAVQGVGALVGISLDKKVKPLPPVTLPYLPGYTGLEPEARKSLDDFLAQLRKAEKLEVTLKNDLAQADLPRAQSLANPTRDEANSLAAQLRSKKTQLLQVRSVVAGESRARLTALGAAEAADSLTQLRAIDRELAQTEDALDRLYDLTRPGAERQADRRTRAAAIEIGKSRLELVRTILLNSGIPNIQQRLRVTNATFNPGDDDQPGRITITTTVTTAKKD